MDIFPKGKNYVTRGRLYVVNEITKRYIKKNDIAMPTSVVARFCESAKDITILKNMLFVGIEYILPSKISECNEKASPFYSNII